MFQKEQRTHNYQGLQRKLILKCSGGKKKLDFEVNCTEIESI